MYNVKNMNMKQSLLDNFPKTIAPMVNMALELGISYQEFNALIKQVFIEESKRIIQQKNHKITDASVSVITGISRTAIAKVMKKSKVAESNPWINFPSRILAAWTGQDLKASIPYSSKEEIDFIALTKGVTTEKPSKTILNEMLRLGLVDFNGDKVTLVPLDERNLENNNKQELFKQFTDNMQSHVQAATSNLRDKAEVIFLEEAVKVDGIHLQSAKQLSKVSAKVWRQSSKAFIDEAQPISDKEEKEGGQHKLTFGVYCYYE
jgi:uncharacterized protein YbcC (UPF0753/DUF2309 family)